MAVVALLASASLGVSLEHVALVIDVVLLEGLCGIVSNQSLTLGTAHGSARAADYVFLTAS